MFSQISTEKKQSELIGTIENSQKWMLYGQCVLGWPWFGGVSFVARRVGFKFFYNSLFPVKSWQDPASIDGEEHNKKVTPTGD